MGRDFSGVKSLCRENMRTVSCELLVQPFFVGCEEYLQITPPAQGWNEVGVERKAVSDIY